MKKYEVTLKYVFTVTMESESEEEARAGAWNEGAELLMQGGPFLQVPIIEKVKEIE